MLFSRQDLDSTQEEPRSFLDAEWDAFLTTVSFVVRGWAAFMYAFVRHSFGREYFSRSKVFGGMLVLSVWSFGLPRDELLPFSLLMAAFIFLVLFHRFRAARVTKDVQHSRYVGWPLVCHVLPISEEVAKSYVEPWLILIIGYGVSMLNQALGVFIAFGALACMFD